jgi:hypothetical protein
MGPYSIRLEDHAQCALLRRHPGGGIVGRYNPAGDSDLSAVRSFQAGDASKQGSLFGAAGADDDEQLVFGDFQVEGFDRGTTPLLTTKRLSKRRIEIIAFMDPSGVALGLLHSPDWEKPKVKLNDCPF